jgi:hypothetical protein
VEGDLISAGFYWFGRDLIAYSILGGAALIDQALAPLAGRRPRLDAATLEQLRRDALRLFRGAHHGFEEPAW